MNNREKFYKDNIEEGKVKEDKLKKDLYVFSVIRLVIVVLAICTTYLLYKKDMLLGIFLGLIIYLCIFLVIAYFHNRKIEDKRKNDIFIKVNEDGLKRLDGTWREFEDQGIEYLNEEHGFINDLDVFGRSSLFQLINTTKTKFGRKILAEKLKLENLPTKSEVTKKQEGIKELAEKIQWRQKLIIESTFNKGGKNEVKELLNWANGKTKIGYSLKVIPYIFITLTIVSMLLVALKKMPFSYLILVFMTNYIVVKLLTKPLSDIIQLFHKHRNDIEAYCNILNLIDKEEFKSEILIELKSKIKNTDIDCCKEMKALKELVDWLGDSSSNAYYLIINVIMLSDTFILRNLESWRQRNGDYLENWLNVMGEFEALASISNLAYDFNKWNYPTILDDNEVYGKNIGHPMLGDRAKVNNFCLRGNEKVALITGSNMSGKSTFLRTLGINLVLSYIGSPTYSDEFNCGVFSIYTCMRTKDNLEESISSFYAEILRIKKVIEASKKGKRVFFLLDEIFKGTNSMDRHEGAKVLINQLVSLGGIGLVSTHDLELCELEKTKKWLVNYNFQEYYENEKIKFDYKLRVGRSTTQNAIHLMKLAGIDFNGN